MRQAHTGVASDLDPAPEVRRLVGTIAELWRYPVKSMLGGTVSEIMVTGRGVLGDRAWALRDQRTGRIVSAKRVPVLLRFRATYEAEPTLASPGLVRIETPDGDTVFGDVPVSQMKPHWTPETMPDYFQLKGGTFLEIGAVFLLASGSVEHLRGLRGGTALIDRRRFRPDFYIDTGLTSGRFVEDDWLGGNLTAGDSVVLGGFAPTLWCVGSTLAQEELPRDPSILRAIVRGHQGCLGVYGSVVSGGLVRAGDPVVLAGPSQGPVGHVPRGPRADAGQ
jgi:MOSC domain-containing protein